MSCRATQKTRSHRSKRNAGTGNYYAMVQRAMYNGKKEFWERFKRPVEVEEN